MSGGSQHEVMDPVTNGVVGRVSSGSGHPPLPHAPDSPHSSSKSRPSKFWERSQSANELDRPTRFTSTSVLECSDGGTGGTATSGGKVSEHSSVYWDLSTADDESSRHGGKFKISLQTIHQKEEMASGSGTTSPGVSFQTRVIRRMSTESATSSAERPKTECSEISLPPATVEFPVSSSTVGSPKPTVSSSPPPPRSDDGDVVQSGMTSTSVQARHFAFTYNNNGGAVGGGCASLSTAGSSSKPNLAATLASTIPVMRENIQTLKLSGKGGATVPELSHVLRNILQMIESAWAMPAIGRDVAYGLCDVLRTDGGVDALLRNCDVDADVPRDLRLGSAQVLAESMTVGNRDYMVCTGGLEVVVRLATCARDDPLLSLAVTGILESLFKHSQTTCETLIRRGGLDAVLYSCRMTDVPRLRRCAVALANLAIYGGADNQQEMIEHRVPEWLFPLAFSDDDSTRYYAVLAISALGSNATLEAAVVRSGTLGLVEPFVRSHDPIQFARSDQAHMHGQSPAWLHRLVPMLLSRRDEAQSLAAFHFAMEAGIRAEQGKLEVFRDIDAIEPLKRLASGVVQQAARFAGQALRLIGEEVPLKLSPQVPLWTSQDVIRWLQQLPVKENVVERFEMSDIDGDLLLMLREEHLRSDLGIDNSVHRIRFLRDLAKLKQIADYESCDPTRLDDWLKELGAEFRQYTYQMLKSGVDRRVLRFLSDEHLQIDCGIFNGVHRMRILEAAKRSNIICSPTYPGLGGDARAVCDRSIDVFISYRRSTGSQLASLLKVHLQLRGLTVFLDIEKLCAGKFDDNLLSSVRNARHFILVLTPNALDRCVGDNDRKDWVHREISAALEGGCNIIPVMDNFQWPLPETLPDDMRPICYFNSIRWIHDYQDACVDKLENFITGGESSSARLLSTTRLEASKASSMTSPPPELHGPVFPSPSVSDGSSSAASSNPTDNKGVCFKQRDSTTTTKGAASVRLPSSEDSVKSTPNKCEAT